MSFIQSILIANRGEIASRIIRSCRKMGIKSIAVFSDADQAALFVQEADTAVHLGESNPAASYLNQAKIIEIALQQGADAIHPGYGFLSENAAFAQKCQDADIIFIGPHPEAIAAMGSKSKAKAIMQTHDVPVVPGYQGEDQSETRLKQEAEQMGFPVLLKATAGGGGKGMRIVHQADELAQSIASAKREALAAFGDDELIVEKYIAQGRHIEFQIFGDQHGNAIHILERECSIQRRYQKVLEESPSPVLNDALREKMGNAAIKAAKALKYDNAGTVEFIFDEQTQAFYFLEVNTRLQVEHPVTEEVTGLDLVEMQIEVAEGKPLPLAQDEVQSKGYAVEARLYAEDPANDFLPATGKVHLWQVPEVAGLRIETAVQSGAEISIHYDPMIAKIIVWDKNRRSAHRKMAYTLKHLKCLGLTTNQDFLLHLFEQDAIQIGKYNTHYLKNHVDPAVFNTKTPFQHELCAIAAMLWTWHQGRSQQRLLRSLPAGWRNNRYAPQQVSFLLGEAELQVQYTAQSQQRFEVQIGENSYAVALNEAKDAHISMQIDSVKYQGSIVQDGQHFFIHFPETGNIDLQQKARFPSLEIEKVSGGYEAPMPSQVVKIWVAAGQVVKAGDPLVVLSSMKMENTIAADEDGVVEEVYVTEGQDIGAGYLLVKVGDG